MLQRRIGMICTSSGCAVCTSPRTNSRADREFVREFELACGSRFTVCGREKSQAKNILLRDRRLCRTQTLQPLADLQRAVEDRSDWNEAEELMPRDGREPRRRDA